MSIVLIGGWLTATALHEAGHAIAARARGFAIISIFVGPLCVTRAPRGGVRLGARTTFLGGSVLAAPRRWEGAERFRRDFFWFVAGGPATSLAIGTIGLMASPERSVIWFCSIISLVIGGMTLIPARYASGRTSDGEKLRRLRHPRPTDAPLAALGCLANPVAPREWDPALVAVATAESVGLEAALFEAAWRGDDAAARAWLARLPSKRKTMTVAKVGRSLWRGGQPSSWLCHRATLERLASNSSSS